MHVITMGKRRVKHRHQNGTVHSHRGGWVPHSHPRDPKLIIKILDKPRLKDAS